MDSLEVIGLVSAALVIGFCIGRRTAAATTPPAPVPPPPADKLQEIRQVLAGGKKIQAIKMYREHTGAGLKEAKDAVERLQD